MAQEAPEICGSRTPHEVIVSADEHRIEKMLEWVMRFENSGRFRYDEGVREHEFYFSDENTASAFKLRFG